ncbi:MAG: hypothetical protein ACLFPS_05845 [Clostridia bacterium]
MNKKGLLGVTILTTIAILIVGLVTVNFLFSEVDTFRAGLNCASPDSISDGTKILCLVGDITIPYYIYIIFALALGGILIRVVF